jgi:dipeptidyl aminopeptidase/acylaminoacyl peptidase
MTFPTLALALLVAGAPEPAWTVADVVLSESARSFQISPDGHWVVWLKETPDEDKGEGVTHLFRTDLASGITLRLTRGSSSCASPRWSPDGKRLAFLSSRPAPGQEKSGEEPEQQLWLMDAFGGEPWPLTSFSREVSAFTWAGPDALVFVAQELPTRQETQRKDREDETMVIEDEDTEPPVRLWRVEVESEKVTRLTDNRDRIQWVVGSPDGRWAVTEHERSLRYTYDNKVKPTYSLVDLKTGKQEAILADPRLIIRKVLWSPDSKGFYVVNAHNSRPQYTEAGILELYYFEVAKKELTRVHLDWQRGLASQPGNDWEPGVVPTQEGFIALLAEGVRPRLARYQQKDGRWQRQWLEGGHARNIFGLAASTDGKQLIYAHSTASEPTQWYHARVEEGKLGEPRQLTKLNDRWTDLPRARTEVMRWPGAGKEEVEGILYYPHAYKPEKKYPLVVMIHGGPASCDFDAWEESWAYAANLFCQRGSFVLKPNYHGSTHYGLAWLESITGGKYAEPELEDIEKGVDALIERGLVDRTRLGVLGWSNGAILTNQLVTRTTRYKAASAGAGNIEYVSDWANCEFGEAFNRFYLGVSPLESPDLYRRKSPFYRLAQVRTPTLIMFGADDRVVPTQQGWVHYRGLQQLGKAPVRFLIFPEEKHSLKKLVYRRRKLEEELRWFDIYLFKSVKEPTPYLAKDSPLAWALTRQHARRVDRRFGVQVGEHLVPEVVDHEGIHVGRFEVTRAQFAEFDATYHFPPGTENYPVAGLSYERARAYCAWLTRVTGQPYRLPSAEEGKALYQGLTEKENTLDHWAGYCPNPEDVARLHEEIQKLGSGALLKEVGSFQGMGKAGVFDLGGNVAEWVSQGKKGILKGGSADLPADPHGCQRQAAVAYRGFRVILEGMGEK